VDKSTDISRTSACQGGRDEPARDRADACRTIFRGPFPPMTRHARRQATNTRALANAAKDLDGIKQLIQRHTASGRAAGWTYPMQVITARFHRRAGAVAEPLVEACPW
jgi:hypothetical protein